MASNFACVGFGVERPEELLPLVEMALPASTWLGRNAGLDLQRWEDESGARVLMTMRRNSVEGLTISYAGKPGATLGNLTSASNGLCTADVVGGGDWPITRLSVDLEEGPLLRRSYSGSVALMALANAVTVHANPEAFTAARESLLDPDGSDDAPLTPRVEAETPRHARMAAESFFPLGLFAPSDEIHARAIINGIVIGARRLTNTATGLSFNVARIKCIGMEVDVCLAEAEHPLVPVPGQVISGSVYMVASLGAPPATSMVDAAQHALTVRIRSVLARLKDR